MQHIETLRLDPDRLTAGLADLEICWLGSDAHLLVSTDTGGTLFSYDLGQGTGRMRETDIAVYTAGSVGTPLKIEMLDVNGQLLALPLGASDRAPRGYVLNTDGSLGSAVQIQGMGDTAIVRLDSLDVGTRTWYFATSWQSEILYTYQMSETGTFSRIAQRSGDDLGNSGGAPEFDTIAIQGTGFCRDLRWLRRRAGRVPDSPDTGRSGTGANRHQRRSAA